MHHEMSLAMRRALYDANHPNVAAGLNNLAIFFRNQRQYDRAAPLLREAIAINRATLDAEHPHVIDNMNTLATVLRSNLGGCLTDLGRYQEAEPLFLASYQTLLDTRGQDDRLTQSTIRYLITLYEAWNKPDEAAIYRALHAEDDA